MDKLNMELKIGVDYDEDGPFVGLTGKQIRQSLLLYYLHLLIYFFYNLIKFNYIMIHC